MTRPDDSFLDAHQLATVRRHADRLLRDASALGRFPTPIDDLLDAAKLTVVDDEMLNESTLRHFMNKAKAGLATIKSAFSKVLGLFECFDRLVVIDKNAPKPKKPVSYTHLDVYKRQFSTSSCFRPSSGMVSREGYDGDWLEPRQTQPSARKMQRAV